MAKAHTKFFRTDVKNMWKLLEDLGHKPVSVKFNVVDGSFRIMTEEHVKAKYPGGAQKSETNEWDVELQDAPH